jgi:hypothetical protein
MTINLENRKKIDFSLITKATKKKPRTFTELLHITRLPRKTLSLRLKELCANGALVKRQQAYELNGASSFANVTTDSTKGLSRVFNDRRMRTGLMLIAFLLCSSVSGYVLAMVLTPQPERTQTKEPTVLGTFNAALEIRDVEDLYCWQAVVAFNSNELKILKVIPGDLIDAEFPFFVAATDFGESTEQSSRPYPRLWGHKDKSNVDDTDILLIGSTLHGEVHGISGSGTLATIVFGYFQYDYQNPEVLTKWKTLHETYGLDSNLNEFPIALLLSIED